MTAVQADELAISRALSVLKQVIWSSRSSAVRFMRTSKSYPGHCNTSAQTHVPAAG